jgi:hypothetical protein
MLPFFLYVTQAYQNLNIFGLNLKSNLTSVAANLMSHSLIALAHAHCVEKEGSKVLPVFILQDFLDMLCDQNNMLSAFEESFKYKCFFD